MASSLMQSLQAALQDLQTVLSPDANPNHVESVARISSCAQALLQHTAEVQQALENKAIAERALRNVVANKEAEAARLRGEVQRLRNSSKQDSPALPTDGTPSQQRPGTDAAADPAARQAVLEAAVAAKEKPTALVHQLQSEVSACQARISALEAELSAAAAEHSSRLAQQQKAFLCKVEQLRQVHNQQVAAAIREAKKQLEQHNTRNKHLEEQVTQARHQTVQQEEINAALRQQLHQQPGAKEPPPPCPVQSTARDSSTSADIAPTAAQALSNAKDQPAAAAAAAADTAPTAAQDKSEAKAAAAAEVAALRDMEAQLMRLSATVKSYQGEREQLRQALMAGCAERQVLQQQVQELTAKLQEAQQGDGAACKQEVQTKEQLSRAYWGSLS